jgi:hypothetical protein
MDAHIGRRDLILSFSGPITTAFSALPGSQRQPTYDDLLDSAIAEMKKAKAFVDEAESPPPWSGKHVFYQAAAFHIADALQKLRGAK